MERLEKILKPRNGDACVMYSLQQVSSLLLIFKQDTNMIIVATSKEAMHTAEGGFASQKNNVQMWDIVEEFCFWDG